MSRHERPEGVTLSDGLRLVPALDTGSDAQRDEFWPSEDPERSALTAGQSHWERSLTQLGRIPLSLLTSPHSLREVLRIHLDELGGSPHSEIEPLLGGHALFAGKRLLLTHGCCSNLRQGLTSWEDAAHPQQPGPIPYFDNGHSPEVSALWEEPWLVLSEEDAEILGTHGDSVWIPRCRLAPQAIERAVRAARQVQEAFAHRLRPFLAERFPAERVGKLAATLAGLPAPGAPTSR